MAKKKLKIHPFDCFVKLRELYPRLESYFSGVIISLKLNQPVGLSLFLI